MAALLKVLYIKITVRSPVVITSDVRTGWILLKDNFGVFKDVHLL